MSSVQEIDAAQEGSESRDISHRVTARPTTIEETGLDAELLSALMLKHLFNGGVLDLHRVAERLALAGNIVEGILAMLRKNALVEVRAASGGGSALRYALTDGGRAEALGAFARGGYVGPAPIPLAQYETVVAEQSVHRSGVTKDKLKSAFDDVVINDSRLDQIGPALNSGRAMMVYGLPGTGKSYICARLSRVFGDVIGVPHALAIGDDVIQFFDPVLHKPVSAKPAGQPLNLAEGHDPRYVLCRRPVAITGGELTLDMLEIDYDPARKLAQAPVQLKATNGIFIVDDLGRQRVPVTQLLNRWIVPMEEHRDFLTLGSGKRFPVPFDVILVFSTNLDPRELADDAFLRRIGYKIHFEAISVEEYRQIWKAYCQQRKITFDHATFALLLTLYEESDRPLLPCHPRDIIGIVVDACLFSAESPRFTAGRVRAAWDMYFVQSM